MAPISLGDQTFSSFTVALPSFWMGVSGMGVVGVVQFPPPIRRFGKQKFRATLSEIGMSHSYSAQVGGRYYGSGNMNSRPTANVSFEECSPL